MRRTLPFALIALATIHASCSRRFKPLAFGPIESRLAGMDTIRLGISEPGLRHTFVYSKAGPWAIHILEVDLGTCYAAAAVKSSPTAIGREKTSVMLAEFEKSGVDVVAGVNADFFSLTPPLGVPEGALIMKGIVRAGPSARPVLAFDAKGRASITTLSARGWLKVGRDSIEITAWNRAAPNGVAYFDSHWGSATDTASGAIEVVLSRRDGGSAVTVDTSKNGVTIPADGAVLIAGRGAPAVVRNALARMLMGQQIRARVGITPTHPREAVGGRPLMRDGMFLSAADSSGAAPDFSTMRHPRTAAGIADGGRKLILVVVDGRRRPYSDGMTLRELADLMRQLGARDAINLDGGGSTTFIVEGKDTARAVVMNRPSDATGERATGDAVSIVSQCKRKS